MLAIAAGTFIFSTALTPVQILMFCLAATPYISNLVTFGVIARDLVRGGRRASGSSPSLWCSSLRVAFGVFKYANSIKMRSRTFANTSGSNEAGKSTAIKINVRNQN